MPIYWRSICCYIGWPICLSSYPWLAVHSLSLTHCTWPVYSTRLGRAIAKASELVACFWGVACRAVWREGWDLFSWILSTSSLLSLVAPNCLPFNQREILTAVLFNAAKNHSIFLTSNRSTSTSIRSVTVCWTQFSICSLFSSCAIKQGERCCSAFISSTSAFNARLQVAALDHMTCRCWRLNGPVALKDDSSCHSPYSEPRRKTRV